MELNLVLKTSFSSELKPFSNKVTGGSHLLPLYLLTVPAK